MRGETFYWDANVFLAYLKNEADDRQGERASAVIKRAEAGEVKILTSALTLVEVIFLRGSPQLKPDQEKVISDFFLHEWILVRQMERTIAELARRLIWEQSVSVKDSIHVATAIAEGVDVMHTFDVPLIGLTGKLGSPALTMSKPPLPVDPMKAGLFAEASERTDT